MIDNAQEISVKHPWSTPHLRPRRADRLRSITSLFTLLAWLGTNVAPHPVRADAAPSFPEFDERVENQSDYAFSPSTLKAFTENRALEKLLSTQVRRARYPGTQGTEPGTPTLGDLKAIEARFQRWRIDIEHILALPPESARAGEEFVVVDHKIAAINAYFDRLAQLTVLRIALKQPHGPAWSDQFGLSVTTEMADHIASGMGEVNTNRIGDKHSSMLVERSADASSDSLVRLKISPGYTQGFELALLSDTRDKGSHLAMIQFLATHQLLSNYYNLRYILPWRGTDLPQVPKRLRDKFETLSVASDIFETQDQMLFAEQAQRLSLQVSYEAIAPQVPRLVTPELAAEIAAIVGSTPKESGKAEAPLFELLQEGESAHAAEELSRYVTSVGRPFSGQTPEERIESLRSALAFSRAKAVMRKILEMQSTSLIPDFSYEAFEQLAKLMSSRQEALKIRIPSDLVTRWRDEAAQYNDSELSGKRRRQFLLDLLALAPEASGETRKAYAGASIDMKLLSQVYAPDLERLAPSEWLSGWMRQIQDAGSYSAARALYVEVTTRELTPGILTGGLVNERKALAAIGAKSFASEETPLTGNTPLVLAARFRERIAQGRKADLETLVKYGGWMGFHRAHSRPNPAVDEVLTDKDRNALYYELVDQQALNKHPILDIVVPFRFVKKVEVPILVEPGYVEFEVVERRIESARLADALVAINPGRTCPPSPETEAQAETLINYALADLENQIRKNIETVGNATSQEEIRSVLSSSMMISLVMSGFPEFKRFEKSSLEELLSPSLLDMAMNRYATPAMMYGFGAMMLMQGTDWIAKRVSKGAYAITHVLNEGFQGVLEGYMRGAMALIVADTAYQISELAHKRSEKRQTEDFFLCSASGPCFSSIENVRAAAATYSRAKAEMVFRITLDLFFMYRPIVRGFLVNRGERAAMRDFAADSQAFETLGLKPGQFGEVERVMSIGRALREKRSIGSVLVSPQAGQGGTWVPVRKGQVLASSAGSEIKAATGGWVRVEDILVAQRLLPRFSKRLPSAGAGMALKSKQGWSAFESAHARLAGKIAQGATYRLPTMVERVAVEDAFRALGLSGADVSSWAKIEKTRALQIRGTPDPEMISRINRAAGFLDKYKVEYPGVATEGLAVPTRPERQLLTALRRSPDVELYWRLFGESAHGFDPLAAVPGAAQRGARAGGAR
jgi:hypothetical protein